MKSSFVLFDVSMKVLVKGKRLHTKTSLSVGKRYLPMGKRASVTTAIFEVEIDRYLGMTLIRVENQQTQPSCDSIPGHIGGRRVLLPLCHPFVLVEKRGLRQTCLLRF